MSDSDIPAKTVKPEVVPIPEDESERERLVAEGKPFGLPGQPGNRAAAMGGRFRPPQNRIVIRAILDTLASRVTNKKAIQKIQAEFGRDMTLREIIHFRQILKAVDGNTEAYKALLDREEGKPMQRNENLNINGTLEDWLDNVPDPTDEDFEDEL